MDSRLSHVVAVAQAGSFTAAATRVGLSQSAVTRSVADLEREIGYAIFTRSSRGAILTELGRDFVERAERLLEDARDLLQRPRENADPYAGVLRIGVSPPAMEFLLSEPLTHLLRRHPAVRLDVSGGTVQRTVQLLRSGGLDVAVGFEAAFKDWPDLKCQRAFNQGRGMLFVRKGHPLLGSEPPTLEALADHDFVSPSDSRPYGAVIRGIYEDEGIDWRQRVHLIDYFPTVKRIVATTNAIGVIVSGFAARSPSFTSQFEVLDMAYPFAAPSPMCCAVRARWEVRPAARALLSILHSEAPPDPIGSVTA